MEEKELEVKETQESMADYAKELEASFRTIREGDIVTGTVISVNEEEVILDLQYYAQGVIKAADMSSDPSFRLMDEVKPGDTLEATVAKTDDGEGNILLSRKEAVQVLAWDELKKDLEEKKVLSVKISEAVKAGVVAYVEGIRGFIPASQLSLSYVENLDEWVGRQVDVRVITVDEEKKRLVLSAKEVEKERKEEETNHKIAMLVPGTITEGVVESLIQNDSRILKDPAPIVALTQRGELRSAQSPTSATSSMPRALAVLMTVPTLPGSCTSSSAMQLSTRSGSGG